MTEPFVKGFDIQLEEWIVSAIQSRPETLVEFLHRLPSVYPALALSTLESLVLRGDVARGLALPILQDARERPKRIVAPSRPLPHPLDYEWRFTSDTANALLKEAHRAAPGGQIAMLGTPTLFKISLATQYRGIKCVLLDSNPELFNLRTNACHRFELCDLVGGPLPTLQADVLIADAPWYPQYIEAFLRAASHMALPGASLYVSLPAIGARPGVEAEIDMILSTLSGQGLRLIERRRLALEYETPFFEANALRAAGVTNVPPNWRRGDLGVFVVEGGPSARNTSTRPQEWCEACMDGVRIRVRSGNSSPTEWVDPRLIPIIEGDVLPSISIRDSRRDLADVWTSGNRVFSCHSPRELMVITKAMSDGVDPLAQLSLHLRRDLNDQERSYAMETKNGLKALIEDEVKDLNDDER